MQTFTEDFEFEGLPEVQEIAAENSHRLPIHTANTSLSELSASTTSVRSYSEDEFDEYSMNAETEEFDEGNRSLAVPGN